MLRAGELIGGRLRVDRIIGVGGFGVVAAATHLELRQEVAIKMLKPEFTDDAEIVDRFLREARAVAGLRTDHVCRVFDVARTEAGAPYIVMELLVGTDVGVLVKQQPLPPAVAVEYIVQACVALAEAHPRGIVHRDLKP
ncbi:MAG TPA: protein kinase, partial [Kofleriaceae bacterium]|nr:protein kinase [Kofleriaceae bacterium]